MTIKILKIMNIKVKEILHCRRNEIFRFSNKIDYKYDETI